MTEEKETKINSINGLCPIIPPTLTDLDLTCLNFPKPRFIVPDLIPEGLTILAGKPKTGKSILAYGLCYSLATGQPALGNHPSRSVRDPVSCIGGSRKSLKFKVVED